MGKLLVKLLDPRAIPPKAAHPGEDTNWDLFALEDVTLNPLHPTPVRTGISALYVGKPGVSYGLRVNARSGMGVKHGIHVLAGEIDAGYRGEIIVALNWLIDRRYSLHNGYEIKAGDRIAQMRPIRVHTDSDVEVVLELPEGKRGDAGFGSSGR